MIVICQLSNFGYLYCMKVSSFLIARWEGVIACVGVDIDAEIGEGGRASIDRIGLHCHCWV